MRKLVFIVPLLLSACTDFTTADQEQRLRERLQTHYQERLDKAPILCRDGVAYILMSNTHGDSVSPHLKPDGKPFTC